MNKKFFKIAGITIGIILVLFYLLFLILPFILNGVINSYSGQAEKLIKDTTGFNLEIGKIQLLTTPKLTAGVKISHAKAELPNADKLFSADNLEVKLSLIPIVFRQIRIDKVSADNLNLYLKVKKDGHFLLEDYIPQSHKDNPAQTASELPFKFKLSNHLPSIYIKNYNLTFTDSVSEKDYSIKGDKINLTDFIFNKKIKVSADSQMYFDGVKQFSVNLKLYNKIMPDMDFNDLVFMQTPNETPKEQQELPFINLIDIFKAISKNKFCANLNADLHLKRNSKEVLADGFLNVDGISIAVDGKNLPDGNLHLNFSGNEIKMLSKLYTADNETTDINGDFRTGKHAKIDLSFKSNAGINNVFNIIDSIAKSFGYKDLDTLSATGAVDADFNIKSDLKKINSNGYFKIPSASIKYALYNVLIDNIKADVDLTNNNVNVKDVSFSVLNQPLKLYGTISQDATTDLHLTADKLLLKALVAAAGQVAILKENDIKSGTLSMDAGLKGKLKNPEPSAMLSIDNVNIKNKPSNTGISLSNAKFNLKTDGKNYSGLVNSKNLLITNPIAKVKVPEAGAVINEKDILINNTYFLIDNSRVDVNGKITDYMDKKLAIDINAAGAMLASDLKMMVPQELRSDIKALGKLPLNVNITGNAKTQNIVAKITANPSNYLSILNIESLKGKNTLIKSKMSIENDKLQFTETGIYTNDNSIASLSGSVDNLSKSQNLALKFDVPAVQTMNIPGFKDSKLSARADINIIGSAMNPKLKGNLSIPSIRIPDMAVSMDNLELILDGVIVNGKATLKRLTSGGIVAENLSADFSLNNNVFYLKNIKGDAFSGKVNGNVSYNILNGKIGVDMKGSGMNALNAIEGAAGIKNALSGTLGFDAKVSLQGATEAEMMKSLKGTVGFNIDNGAFLNIGKLENLLTAQNLNANTVLRTALAPVTSLTVIKNTANFKYIKGELAFNGNGWADVKSIKTSGSSMAYFITGRYNLLNGSANLAILGRLGADVVKALGPLGELSVSKLTSYIPKFGALTGSIINAITTNPKGENVAAIPALSGGNTSYKDFKVSFNGGIESKSSVKSFKWLSDPDMSAIEAPSIKEQVQSDIKSRIDAINKAKEDAQTRSQAAKEEYKQQAEDIKNSVEDLKNLFKF